MLSRLWVVMLLLCSLPLNGAGGESIHGVRGKADKTECIASHDGWHSDMMQQHRMALAGTVITAKTGERVGGSRPSRLMPTHGGKPGRTIGRWAVSSSFPAKHERRTNHTLLTKKKKYRNVKYQESADVERHLR